jgi:hypothetical protein
MVDRGFVAENEATRVELSEFIARLDDSSFKCPVGSGWTISTSLCHLAFWDQRVLFYLRTTPYCFTPSCQATNVSSYVASSTIFVKGSPPACPALAS